MFVWWSFKCKANSATRMINYLEIQTRAHIAVLSGDTSDRAEVQFASSQRATRPPFDRLLRGTIYVRWPVIDSLGINNHTSRVFFLLFSFFLPLACPCTRRAPSKRRRRQRDRITTRGRERRTGREEDWVTLARARERVLRLQAISRTLFRPIPPSSARAFIFSLLCFLLSLGPLLPIV